MSLPSMPGTPEAPREPRHRRAVVLRVLLATALGVAAAVLVACGGSGKGLIPGSVGEPLQSDVEAVDQAAQEGNGNCSATEAALLKIDQDYSRLPASLNASLRSNLKLGIENLHKVAKEACLQPLAGTATTPAKTTSTPTTTTTTTPPPTTSSQTTTTPPPETSETPEESAGGGTPAPGEGGGTGAGGTGAEEGHGNGNGGDGSGG